MADTRVNEGRWGEALWNQRPRIDAYTEDNIRFTDEVREMVRQVAAVELKYAKEMRQVLRAHEKVLSDQNTTVAQAWRQIFTSLDTLALAHESVANDFNGEMTAALADLSKVTTKRRKELLAECATKDATMQKELDVLDKERGKFNKLCKDEESASQAYAKAESSDTVTKAKVEKARKTWEGKARIREEGQKKLQDVLDQVNSKRVQFYHIEMPETIDKIQATDEARSEGVVRQIASFAGGFNKIGVTCTEAAAAIKAACDNHDKFSDSKVFAQLHKTTDHFPAELTVSENAPVPQAAPQEQAVAVPQTLGVEAHAADDDEELPEMSAAAQYPQTRILFDYAADDGTITCAANEVLGVVENDGSGWVLVIKQDGVQGYVPATYLQE